MAVSNRLRFEVFKRDNFTCQYCGAVAPKVSIHIDHSIPKARGGDDSYDNLITACESCNYGKSDIPIEISSLEDGMINSKAAQMTVDVYNKYTNGSPRMSAIKKRGIIKYVKRIGKWISWSIMLTAITESGSANDEAMEIYLHICEIYIAKGLR